MTKKHPINYVPYSENHLDSLVLMWRESFEKAVGIVDPNPIENQKQYFNEKVLSKNEVMVAESQQAVVGFVAASADSIDQLYVHNNYQRLGIGSELLSWAQLNSCGKLQLYTFESNKNAQRFYEHKGFKLIEKGFEPVWKLNDIKYEWVRTDTDRI